MSNVVVVGGGPAGIRAACMLAAHRLRPVLLDEARNVGGQGYRAPSPGLRLDMDALMGGEAAKYHALQAAFASIRDQIEYRPGTLVWAIEGKTLHVATDEGSSTVSFDALILATGAMDRIMPLPGWTLPGVFALGGAQVSLKDQGCFIGRRVAFCGSSPLLNLAALQYRKLGADVVAVCDTTPLGAKVRAAPQLAAAPRTMMRGISYLTSLMRAGTPMLHGVTLLRIEGKSRVEAIIVRDCRGRERRFACDAVALGYGLKPEAQLAELAGAEMRFDATSRLWLPKIDADGRAGRSLYLAGDSVVIGGADAAEASGELAARAVLSDLGIVHARSVARGLRRRVFRLRRFQRALARAFVWPANRVKDLSDDVALCRCENVSVGEIRRAMDQALGPIEVNRVKAITRCGMGRCQGRVCGPALQELVASHAGIPIEAAGRLRVQAPVKPIPLSVARTLAE
ncbi:NAD(P)/FAD-dependent oxidoreductase [Microvirga brassicacearum]|uniref:FAD/NAD(P)-binding oxidoreductase n=1 Tax=Microvirga brassicacearum TaxID=2580413 RepID=A0A5N3P895_9HYPH|nr:NAD(P)/FAD-dependent oxidoreductase [Microvirga brassicacearum]KAB0265940.1 FAD/NAD(P)-binding oxidoreductase [Microvirga brassicacearum]